MNKALAKHAKHLLKDKFIHTEKEFGSDVIDLITKKQNTRMIIWMILGNLKKHICLQKINFILNFIINILMILVMNIQNTTCSAE